MLRNVKKETGHLQILQLDFQVPFVMHVSLCQEHSVTVITSLTQHFDGDFNIEMHLTFIALHSETQV